LSTVNGREAALHVAPVRRFDKAREAQARPRRRERLASIDVTTPPAIELT
jgi:hypothetical protein